MTTTINKIKTILTIGSTKIEAERVNKKWMCRHNGELIVMNTIAGLKSILNKTINN